MARIILSGVGPGMGCSVARLLVESGHGIGIVSRGEKGRKVASDLGTEYVSCDLGDPAETAGAFRELSTSLGGLDGLVHLAGGFFAQRKTEEVDGEFFRQALDNNAGTFFNAVGAALPLFSRNGGSIVAISAARSVYINSNMGYAAAKGAIDYMVRLLARELAPRNIRVNSVSPGFISKENCGEPEPEKGIGAAGRHSARSVAEAVNALLFNRIATGQILEVDAGFSSMPPDGLK